MEDKLADLLAQGLTPILKQVIREEFQSIKQNLTKAKDDTLYTRKEVAVKLNISLPTLNRHMNDGTITPQRIGSRVLFSVDDINKCLTRLKVV